jgi:AraC-like DNA-binding protein
MLEKEDLTIMEITYRVGMSDSRYFAKCFKNTYGVTPTEYRQQAKKQK